MAKSETTAVNAPQAAPPKGAGESTPSPSGESQPGGGQTPPAGLDPIDELKADLQAMRAEILTLRSQVEAKSGQRTLTLPPLEQEIGELPEAKKRQLAAFEVTITRGPNKDKFVQPIVVEALHAAMARRRVTRAGRLDPNEDRLAAERMGPVFVVDTKEKAARGQDFPRKVGINSAEAAIELAAQYTKRDPEELKAEAA